MAALDAARKIFRSRIESSQGRVIDMAREKNPEDRRMRFRIGIHLGDVIEKADGTVYGDGVNIAARLEGLAEPGGITVSESVHTAVRGKVSAEFLDRGEQQVKNIAHPVRAFAVRTDGHIAARPSSTAGAIDLSLPDKPSIAVLPFANMSGDPEQEYFTDGITEDIITELSRFHSLFVIARNSTFTYKGKAVDVRTVAKELGVRYVLEARRRPENLSAYEIAARGYALAWDSAVKSDRAFREQAILEANKALAIDPRSSLALNVLAFAQWQHVVFRTASDFKAAFEEGMAAAEKSIEVDPSDSDPYTHKAWLQQFAPEQPRWAVSKPMPAIRTEESRF